VPGFDGHPEQVLKPNSKVTAQARSVIVLRCPREAAA